MKRTKLTLAKYTTNAREAHRPAFSSQNEVITMLKGLKTNKQTNNKKQTNKQNKKTQRGQRARQK